MYFGSHDIAFDELGPSAVIQRGPPTVVGMLRGGHTLDLRLAPEYPQRIELTGRLDGDSVSGRWRAARPRGIDATGDFVLRRR